MMSTTGSFSQCLLTRRRLCGVLLPAFIMVGGLSIGGCGRETQGTQVRGQQSTLSIPPENFVRIVSRQIADAPPPSRIGETGNKTNAAPKRLHYKWSVIGERNWQNPKADKSGFVLGDVYPLNDTRRRGGCNIWECDLTAQSFVPSEQTKPMMGAEWHLIIHGSNGQTAAADGKTYYDAKQKMAEAIRVVQTRDEAIALPADILLARIGDDNAEVRLKVAAQ